MIYTVSTTSVFLGFFMLYNTSLKAKLSRKGKFERWLQQNPSPARITGLVLIGLAFVLLPLKMGVVAGLLTSFFLLLAAAALTVSVAPFYYLTFQHVAALVAGTFLLELLFAR